MKSIALLMLSGALFAADAAADAPAIPPQVLADAQQIATKPSTPSATPSPAALQTADTLDVLLLTATTFLANQQTDKAGERFITAVQTMETLTRADKRALGPRYVEQRRQLSALANRLLADPAVAATLGDTPLVPTPAEERTTTASPVLDAAPAPAPATK